MLDLKWKLLHWWCPIYKRICQNHIIRIDCINFPTLSKNEFCKIFKNTRWVYVRETCNWPSVIYRVKWISFYACASRPYSSLFRIEGKLVFISLFKWFIEEVRRINVNHSSLFTSSNSILNSVMITDIDARTNTRIKDNFTWSDGDALIWTISS